MSFTKKQSEEAESFNKDGWSRFERAVDAAVKGGPKHKLAPAVISKKERPATKGRVHKGKTKA